MLRSYQLSIFATEEHLDCLKTLPWHISLEEWRGHGVRHLQIRSGLSRHLVIFIERNHQRYAIKQTSPEIARREIENYHRLKKLELPTLHPAGYVVTDNGKTLVNTAVGMQMEDTAIGFCITQLAERVLPDSLLYNRDFESASHFLFLDAAVELFVMLHVHRVYWGDASPANMLMHFSKLPNPPLRPRRAIQALLADAETVEICKSLSPARRQQDLDLFLESLQWMEADRVAAGKPAGNFSAADDAVYVQRRYQELFSIYQEMEEFEKATHLNIDEHVPRFYKAGAGRILLKHINEHRWYLGERRKKEVSVVEAAQDWLQNVYAQVCEFFNRSGLYDDFPSKTAADLYLDIMENKYFLSQRAGVDVGIAKAVEDYWNRFREGNSAGNHLRKLAKGAESILQPSLHARRRRRQQLPPRS
jgi:hypothetical protein